MLALSFEHALKNQELQVYYQPQACTDTGEIVGVEALVRWQHPYWGNVPPSDFIPIAEKLNWIWTIDKWVMKTACQQMADWHAAGYPLKLSINWSARNFQNPDVVDRVAEILKQMQLDPVYLEIELTETILLEDFQKALATMRGLCRLGVRVALDDFGTGYSSFFNLKQFPFNSLKIDRSFMNNLYPNSKNAIIVKSIIEMGHLLHLDVVGEGVETEEQLEFLHQHHCNAWQGYLLSAPITAAYFTEVFLRGDRKFFSLREKSLDAS
jgi:EAL domain-containing protein (putative c-di-GMP-specific phosphodiesterase class I)